MAKQGGLFSGGDPSLMTMAYKAAAAEKPVDISGTLESASQAYKEGLETLGEGLSKAAKVIGEQAAELWRTKYKEKFRFAANQFLIDNNIDPWDPFGTKTTVQDTTKKEEEPVIGLSDQDMDELQYGSNIDNVDDPLYYGVENKEDLSKYNLKIGQIVQDEHGKKRKVTWDEEYNEVAFEEVKPPPNSVTVTENGIIQNIAFNATDVYLKDVLQPLAEKLRTLDKGSEEYAKTELEYKQKRDNFIRTRQTMKQNEAIIGDMIENKTYDVNASANYQQNGTSNLGFANVLLLKGRRDKDGSYVVQGTDQNGNASYTWLDSTGNIRLKDDGSPWVMTEEGSFDLLIPKNIEYQANVVSVDLASKNAGMNAKDAQGNKIEFEEGFQQEYTNSIINSIANSTNPDQTYKNAIYEKSGLADQNYVEALHAVKLKGGTYAHDPNLFNETLWNSLDSKTWNLDGSTDGVVDEKDFQTKENFNKLIQHLQVYSPENAKIFANWKSETSGRSEYEDGWNRRKQEKTPPGRPPTEAQKREKLLKTYIGDEKFPVLFPTANDIVAAWEGGTLENLNLPISGGANWTIQSRKQGGKTIFDLVNVNTKETLFSMDPSQGNSGLYQLLNKFGASGQNVKDFSQKMSDFQNTCGGQYGVSTTQTLGDEEERSIESKIESKLDLKGKRKVGNVATDLQDIFNSELPKWFDIGDSEVKVTKAPGARGKNIIVTVDGIQVGKYHVEKTDAISIFNDVVYGLGFEEVWSEETGQMEWVKKEE